VQVVRGECPELAARLEQQTHSVTDWCIEHGETLKEAAHSWVGFVELEGASVYVKVFRAKGLVQQLSTHFGRHRALRSFASANHLLKARLPVPEPIACLRAGADMLLVTKRLPCGDDFLSLWQSEGELLPAEIWHDAGVMIGQLHSAGFVHRDCKWSNIYRADDQQYLLDLESVAHVGAGASGLYRDIARFVLDAEDMGASLGIVQTFLTAYSQEVGSSVGEVSSAALPQLKRLRLRHERKYGIRGHALLHD